MARCSTPNLCCSSITTRPSFAKLTSFWITACVPTTSSHAPVGNLGQRLPAFARRQAARQAEPADAAMSQRRVYRGPMLVGEDFRRRHEDRLMTGGDRDQNRVHGDRRLSRPDVGLQQAVHRVAGGQILADFADCSALALGEGEGKQPADPRVDFRRRRQDRGRTARFPTPPPQRQSRAGIRIDRRKSAAAGPFRIRRAFWACAANARPVATWAV